MFDIGLCLCFIHLNKRVLWMTYVDCLITTGVFEGCQMECLQCFQWPSKYCEALPVYEWTMNLITLLVLRINISCQQSSTYQILTHPCSWTATLPMDDYTPTSTKFGYTGFTLSVCPSVCPSVCGQNVSTLYLPEYQPNPFHIYTSYQPSSDGVLHVFFFFIPRLSGQLDPVWFRQFIGLKD